MMSILSSRRSVCCLMVAMVMAALALSQESPVARPLVILIGPPLSGKTTFVTRIQQRYGVPGISVEDLIKDHAAELMKMHRGRTAMAEMRYDPAMSRYVRARLNKMDLGRGAALDGFPATKLQAGDLAKMIQELRLTPVALQLEIPDEVVRKRAGVGSGCLNQTIRAHLEWSAPRLLARLAPSRSAHHADLNVASTPAAASG